MMASVSAIFGVRIAATEGSGAKAAPAWSGAATVECSSRPQKKATKHHMKTRPKKTQPWDIKRKPTVYPAMPALPADWTLVEAAAVKEESIAVEAEVVESA
uniref:50S ribosomal protein 6, chloroplastic n=1 Tax=Kalanchoe fedtschenkoi TaxID=63787 RepID=A0A7N1A9W4_KALFE